MKIVLVQSDIVWADPKANAKSSEAYFEKHKGADLFVLPEMFSTGFATAPKDIAEPFLNGSCQSLEWMKEMASRYDAAVAGSVNICLEGKYLNRFFFVEPEGKVTFYDKHHLFTMGGEGKTFTSGDKRVVLEFRGVKIRLAVCYDLRFPGWLRNTPDLPYDLLLCVASWPSPRRSAWDTLLRARAIENQCYVAGVNRTGDDPFCKYSGGTALIDAYGNTVASCADLQVASTEYVLDMEELAAFRKSFPVLGDQDSLNFD